jgi:hypothetical protein
MGSTCSVFANKSIYLSYDISSKDLKIWEFTISLNKLPIKLFMNEISKINESDIMIHLISNATLKHHKQLNEINMGLNKISIFIYTDCEVPNTINNNLSKNKKSISISYLNYNNFQEIFPIILTKLNDL